MFIRFKHHNYAREIARFIKNVEFLWPRRFADAVLHHMVQDGYVLIALYAMAKSDTAYLEDTQSPTITYVRFWLALSKEH